MTARALRALCLQFAAVAFAAAGLAEARSAEVGAHAGTRWSTVELAKTYQVEPQTTEAEAARQGAKLKEVRATLRERALAAGAELVWDLDGETLIGISPVLFAEPALALPAQGPARVLTVDMAKLYDKHPKTLTQNALIQASDQRAQEKVNTMNAAGNALVAEYKTLQAGGDEAAAAKKLAQITAKTEEIKAFIAETGADLQKQVNAFRDTMLKELSAEAVAAARKRGATVVLDTAGPTRLGVSNLVYIDPALRPAPSGGVRSEPAPVALVRTVDLARLYDRHPTTLAVNARIKTDDQKAREETERMNRAGASLMDEYRTLSASGDKAAAEKTLAQLTAKQQQVKAHQKDTREASQQRLMAHRRDMLAEIAKTASEVARRTGANLLLDTAGASHLGASPIAYAAPQLDLTEDIAKEMKIALER